MQPLSIDTPCAKQTPSLFWWILGTSFVLALIPTIWTGLDMYAAGIFIGPSPQLQSVSWWWVELINAYIPTVLRYIVLLALVGWLYVTWGRLGKSWRLPLAFVVLAATLGPGIVVNSGFKENWHRARPYQVEAFGGAQQFTRATVISDQCYNNCSFVSGHVACGIFLVSLMLVDRKRQRLWAVSGLLTGGIIGFARMSDGAHWLSDVLWASPITLVCSWIVWKILLRLYQKTPNSPG